MPRRWNILIWIGFAIVLLGLLTYVPIFVLFPVTRDIPWVNFLLILAGGWLLALGMKRAFGQPELYRGKISGSILSVLSLLMVGFFCYGMFYAAKDLPASSSALRVGQPAPSFTLSNATGQQVALSDQLKNEFRERGVEPIAISVDPTEASRKLCHDRGYTYPFLSDPKAETIRRYRVLHAKGGEGAKALRVPLNSWWIRRALFVG